MVLNTASFEEIKKTPFKWRCPILPPGVCGTEHGAH